MDLPATNETSPQLGSRIICGEPRCVLRGEVSDAAGKGEFVFSRQHQIGSREVVEYESQNQGIAAINTFADTKKNHDNTDDQFPADRLLQCRYSVIAEVGNRVDFLKIFVSFVDVSFPGMRITLSWRGESLAKLVDPDNLVAGRDDGSFIRKDETVILECGPTQNDTWYIEVPSHSMSMAIQIDGDPSKRVGGSLSINADTVFSEKNRSIDVPKGVKYSSGTGRIQPKKVLEIIERVENIIEQTPAEGVGKSGNSGENQLIYTTPESSVEDDTVYTSNASSSNIDVVVSQKIMVFHGEDIILGTEGMFINRVTGDASYISANLPDWLFLDQKNGDLMGTVPVHDDDNDDLEFSIYAVDGTGNSAKAVIPISCSIPQSRLTEDLKDNEFCEGGQVSFTTDTTGLKKGFSNREMQLSTDNYLNETELTFIPVVRAFAPERHVFLQVHNGDESEVENSNFKYAIQLSGHKELPDWIEFTSNGFVWIGCDPERRYVDLELIQSGDDGYKQVYDICVDTFEGNLMPVFHRSDSFIEKQLQEVSAA